MAREVDAPSEETPEEKEKLNRREALNLAWLASLGILSLDLGVVTYFFSLPRFKEGEIGGTFTLGPAADLPPVNVPPVSNPKGRFWLTRTDQGLLALFQVCTHLGCLYQWLDTEGKFRCPCHGSEFSYEGEFLDGPAPRSLDRFVIQVLDPASEEVVLETDPQGGPLEIPEDPNLIVRVDTGRRIFGPRRSGGL